MRLSRNKKKVAQWDRRGELLKSRAASDKLSEVCPDVARVNVELEFESQALLAHARQSFSLFPAAKAHFVYPCPFGDCDGVYDLQSVALATLKGHSASSSGSLKCTGNRTRDGLVGVPCGLEVSYSIAASYETEEILPKKARGGA